jgi:hypothetical protein
MPTLGSRKGCILLTLNFEDITGARYLCDSCFSKYEDYIRASMKGLYLVVYESQMGDYMWVCTQREKCPDMNHRISIDGAPMIDYYQANPNAKYNILVFNWDFPVSVEETAILQEYLTSNR